MVPMSRRDQRAAHARSSIGTAWRRAWAIAALVVSFPVSGSVQASESVWEALRAPGAVVVLRHSYAPGTFDPPDARLDDCSTQRNLDDAGRAQATRIGEAFKANRISVGPVLSSPRCRCLDTARLAFGKVESWDVLQGSLRDTDLHARLVGQMRSRMAAHQDGPPLVLVTHGSVVVTLTGVQTRMGEFVVLRRTAEGTHVVAGQLYVD
jgi:broad specificity phosphatase PhoE